MLEVRGLDAASGTPKTIAVPVSELLKVWDRYSDPVISAILAALGETPPELSQDILEDGITLTGGAAMTGLLGQRIQERTGIEVRIAPAPLGAVASGLGQLLQRGVMRPH